MWSRRSFNRGPTGGSRTVKVLYKGTYLSIHVDYALKIEASTSKARHIEGVAEHLSGDVALARLLGPRSGRTRINLAVSVEDLVRTSETMVLKKIPSTSSSPTLIGRILSLSRSLGTMKSPSTEREWLRVLQESTICRHSVLIHRQRPARIVGRPLLRLYLSPITSPNLYHLK